MSLNDNVEQEMTEVSEGPLEGSGSVLVCYQYVSSSGSDQALEETSESTLALARVRTNIFRVRPERS